MICHSTSGDLFCKETRQKFSSNYYTLKTKDSSLIKDLEARGSRPKDGTGIAVVFPSGNFDKEKLKALIEGETFPGSGVLTRSVLTQVLSEQDLNAWKLACPELFGEKEQPKQPKKQLSAKSVEEKKADDPFGALEV